MRQRVRQYPFSYDDRSVLRMLLSSIPADVSTPERWRRDVTEWLILNRGQLQKLSPLPVLARVLKRERNDDVLLAMAGYVPEAAEVSAHRKAARAVIAHWEALSREAFFGGVRQAAWVARWNFLRAGVLTAEEQGRFGADYVKAIGAENDRNVLLALAQTRPPGSFPLDEWKRRLSDRNNECRLAAGLAIHGWLVDMASSEQRVASRELPLATRHSPLATRF